MWAERNQAQTEESKAKRERRKNNKEPNSTCTRATNSRGLGPPAARLTTSIQPPEGLTNRAGRTRRGTPRPGEGRETPAARLTSSVLPQRALQTERARRSQSHEPKVSRYSQGEAERRFHSRKHIKQQASECTLHGLGPARAHGSNLATRLTTWAEPKTPQHRATHVAECLRPGSFPICYEARRWRLSQ